MRFGAMARFAAVATGLLMPLALGGCAVPAYRYVSGPCGPTPGWGQAAAKGTPATGSAGQGTAGKQCVYAVRDYAGGPVGSYAFAGYPYDGFGFYDGLDYGYPYWLGGWAGGFGGFYGIGFYGHGYYGHGYYGHGFYGHGFPGGWGGWGGWGGFHGGGVAAGGFHGGGGGGRR